jgi:hypothetical protein
MILYHQLRLCSVEKHTITNLIFVNFTRSMRTAFVKNVNNIVKNNMKSVNKKDNVILLTKPPSLQCYCQSFTTTKRQASCDHSNEGREKFKHKVVLLCWCVQFKISCSCLLISLKKLSQTAAFCHGLRYLLEKHL